MVWNARSNTRSWNPEHLHEALRHRSLDSRVRAGTFQRTSEFLGDTILQLVVTDFIFSHYPDHPEGDLAKLRSSAVNKDVLHGVARQLGLGAYLMLGKGEEVTGGSSKPSILADAMEAVLGSGLPRRRPGSRPAAHTAPVGGSDTAPGRVAGLERLQEPTAGASGTGGDATRLPAHGGGSGSRETVHRGGVGGRNRPGRRYGSLQTGGAAVGGPPGSGGPGHHDGESRTSGLAQRAIQGQGY